MLHKHVIIQIHTCRPPTATHKVDECTVSPEIFKSALPNSPGAGGLLHFMNTINPPSLHDTHSNSNTHIHTENTHSPSCACTHAHLRSTHAGLFLSRIWGCRVGRGVKRCNWRNLGEVGRRSKVGWVSKKVGGMGGVVAGNIDDVDLT